MGEPKTEYQFEQIIKVVKREQNQKRKFLFLNTMQAKYTPANPEDTLHLFKALGEEIQKDNQIEKTIVIGFAETATAIGAVVAKTIAGEVYYIHTTRERLKDEYLLVSFEEEHSHAKKHDLYGKESDIFKKCNRIIFVDDELTTGKTICNFVDVLRKKQMIRDDMCLVAASLLNCMSKESMEQFKKRNIQCKYLMQNQMDFNNFSWQGKELDIKRGVVGEGKCSEENFGCTSVKQDGSAYITYQTYKGETEIRTGAYMKDYEDACNRLCDRIEEDFAKEIKQKKSILVLGTEECMYPAISFGNRIKNKDIEKEVMVHATSRSPIAVLDEKGYPIRNRNVLGSCYEKERNIYLYNLKRYDYVFVITDAKKVEQEVWDQMADILQSYENENIAFIQWEA